jgi:hypothetical protein
VLSRPAVVASVTEQLADLTEGELDTLILNGDVWEECVPAGISDLGTGEIFQHSVLEASRRFFGNLFARVDVRRVVWIPGNHDLSLWYRWCRENRRHPHTSYKGMVTDRSAWFEQLLPAKEVPKLTVSYPIFLDDPWGGWPYRLFTHGHLLDPLVRGLEPDPVYLALRGLDCPRPRVPIDPYEIRSVEEIARLADPFSLALWSRYSKRDYVFQNQILRRLDPFLVDGGRLVDVPWFLDVVMGDPGLPSPVGTAKPSCFVFGHDHLGDQRMVDSAGASFAVFGSGGWTSEFDGHRPCSRVLVWEAPGQIVPEAFEVKTY